MALQTASVLIDHLRRSSFIHFLFSRSLSSLAFQGSAVAIAWLVYDRTRNPFDLGLIGLSQFLPMFVLTLVVGQVADVFDRRKIALTCQAIQAAILLTLAIGVLQGWLATWGIFLGVALVGAAQAFERPALTALLPGIVPRSELQRAIATSTSVMQSALIVGPALGGLLYGVNPTVPFLLSALFYALAAANIGAVSRPETQVERRPISRDSIVAGARFVASRPIILAAISLDMVVVLMSGATALLPIYARDILHAGPWALGLLRMAPALGAVAMSLYLARRPLKRHVGNTMLVAVAIFGCATISFAFSTNIALSVAALIVLGASDTISVVIRSTLVQLLTPDEMRGRVGAINSLFIGTSNQLGEFRAGMFAGLAGPVFAVAFGGFATLAIVFVWLRQFPELRSTDQFPEPPDRPT